ncbi:MAG: hypothetical protein PHO64_12200 [Thiomonas sp.]|nr:hypothetical protein [Thiomonas sp.]
MSAPRAQTPPLGVALGVVSARRADGHGCALRLDRGRLDAQLGHAGFIHTL